MKKLDINDDGDGGGGVKKIGDFGKIMVKLRCICITKKKLICI